MSEPGGYDDLLPDLLPEQTRDDVDEGWGEPAGPDEEGGVVQERPPHWSE